MISSLRQTVSLSDRAADGVSDNLRPREAAAYVGLSESTLAKLRMRENRPMGPVFHRLGGSVIYRRADLDAWIDANRVEKEDK